MCMWDDGPGWTELSVAVPVARKQHRCGECGGKIRVGERYRKETGLSDGEIDTFKTCLPCFTGPCAWLTRVCNGYLFNGVAEDLREHFDYAQEHGIIKPGERFAVGRLLVGMKRRRLATEPVPA